ncbi:gypsy retrotransposon integrase-like protein 1 [Plakobranchus ocellatus]|uniref:Gypsy retrotransposon integrase-like protein 1 n=1 Tax=Plakobranchus ocellatus TaxID=259542 RepID=A0AAV4ACR6_9GAST|nr:gypsy retrotransposon integrase-like protein 1 [Plakobranchus ocellatus]
MEVMDDLQSEVEDGMPKLASGKSVPVMTNCAALRDPEKTRSLGLPVLKGEIGGREVDVMRDTGCEGVAMRKQLVDASQMTGEYCLLLRIDKTALLAEKAVISLRTPFLSGEVKALCIPNAICDVIKLQQEDPRILALVDAGRTSRRGGKVVSFERARGIVYRRYEDLGRNVNVKQVVLPKPLREYVMSVAYDSITGAHLGIMRTKDKVLSNFYWPGVDGDVTRYCWSCDVCQRTVKKGTVPRVPLEKVPLIDTPFKRVAIDLKTTTLYHPICNGLVERFNATLKTCLRHLCSEQPRQWHRYINPLLFAYREVPLESTHFDLFELLYGRTVRGPMHILRELWTKEIEEPDVKSSYEYVLNLRERLDDTLMIAREEVEKSQGR